MPAKAGLLGCLPWFGRTGQFGRTELGPAGSRSFLGSTRRVLEGIYKWFTSGLSV
jgi:hypothetical protein